MLVPTAEPGRWGIGVQYDPSQEPPADFAAERCVTVIDAALGRSDIPVEIEDITSWEQGVAVADRFRGGRVFLASDSAHVLVPLRTYRVGPATEQAELVDLDDQWLGRYGVVLGSGGSVEVDGQFVVTAAQAARRSDAEQQGACA